MEFSAFETSCALQIFAAQIPFNGFAAQGVSKLLDFNVKNPKILASCVACQIFLSLMRQSTWNYECNKALKCD